MKYTIRAQSTANLEASIAFTETTTSFGITKDAESHLPSPADLFLSAFAACVLKNVERFSAFMKFTYERAEIEVSATRLEKPPRMDQIHYTLKIYSNSENLNVSLLKKNLEKFGTIYNTVERSSSVDGEILVIRES